MGLQMGRSATRRGSMITVYYLVLVEDRTSPMPGSTAPAPKAALLAVAALQDLRNNLQHPRRHRRSGADAAPTGLPYALIRPILRYAGGETKRAAGDRRSVPPAVRETAERDQSDEGDDDSDDDAPEDGDDDPDDDDDSAGGDAADSTIPARSHLAYPLGGNGSFP
jgi:hypothetical protein